MYREDPDACRTYLVLVDKTHIVLKSVFFVLFLFVRLAWNGYIFCDLLAHHADVPNEMLVVTCIMMLFFIGLVPYNVHELYGIAKVYRQQNILLHTPKTALKMHVTSMSAGSSDEFEFGDVDDLDTAQEISDETILLKVTTPRRTRLF